MWPQALRLIFDETRAHSLILSSKFVSLWCFGSGDRSAGWQQWGLNKNMSSVWRRAAEPKRFTNCLSWGRTSIRRWRGLRNFAIPSNTVEHFSVPIIQFIVFHARRNWQTLCEDKTFPENPLSRFFILFYFFFILLYAVNQSRNYETLDQSELETKCSKLSSL